jgi:thymidylate synthase
MEVYNLEETQYLALLSDLLASEVKEDRTGVGTLSQFGSILKFSLEGGQIPLLTTKRVFFRGVVEELLFFIRGDRDSKKLEEKGVKIWTGNTTREFLDNRGLKDYEEGDIGPMYGVQWRNFGGTHDPGFGVDQLQQAFDTIKNNPTSRRIIVSAYNPVEKHLGCLEPCHMMFQFNVRDDKLDCLFYMRSIDTFLGLPFNIASYAILTHLMAKATGLKAGNLVFQGGDTHLYKTHIEQAKEQRSREPRPFPILKINKDLNSLEDIEKIEFEDFELVGYNPHAAIKAEMAV